MKTKTPTNEPAYQWLLRQPHWGQKNCEVEGPIVKSVGEGRYETRLSVYRVTHRKSGAVAHVRADAFVTKGRAFLA